MNDNATLTDRQTGLDLASTAAASRREERSKVRKAKAILLSASSPTSPEGAKAAQAALGNQYEICSPSGELFRRDERTGSMVFAGYTPQELRRQRYELQHISRAILASHPHPSGSKTKQLTREGEGVIGEGGKIKRWAVSYCQRGLAYGAGAVAVQTNAAGRAKFGQLAICGSVWTCPCCAAKVTEYRKLEILEGMIVHKDAGGSQLMLTFTFPHSKDQNLRALILMFRDALRRMRSRDEYTDQLKDLSYVGMIRALEVTWGVANGWHPHSHELWLFQRPLSLEETEHLEASLKNLWWRALSYVGLVDQYDEKTHKSFDQHGIDLKRGEQVTATYLTKWGVDHKTAFEMTKWHTKTDRSGVRFTPFDFLRQSITGEMDFWPLWREFVDGTFGSRQVFWSKGLKDRFQLKELSDEQIAEQDTVPHTTITTINREKWMRVIWGHRDYRSELLLSAEKDGAVGVHAFIESLPPVPPPSKPTKPSKPLQLALDAPACDLPRTEAPLMQQPVATAPQQVQLFACTPPGSESSLLLAKAAHALLSTPVPVQAVRPLAERIAEQLRRARS